MTIDFQTDFLSAACNTVSDALEWSADWDLVAFAAHQMVALYRPITQSNSVRC
jgi:hypothetical protein